MKPENKEELLIFIKRELLARKKALVPLEDILKIFNPNPSESINNSAGMLAGSKAIEWLDSNNFVYSVDDVEIKILPNY